MLTECGHGVPGRRAYVEPRARVEHRYAPDSHPTAAVRQAARSGRITGLRPGRRPGHAPAGRRGASGAIVSVGMAVNWLAVVNSIQNRGRNQVSVNCGQGHRDGVQAGRDRDGRCRGGSARLPEDPSCDSDRSWPPPGARQSPATNRTVTANVAETAPERKVKPSARDHGACRPRA